MLNHSLGPRELCNLVGDPQSLMLMEHRKRDISSTGSKRGSQDLRSLSSASNTDPLDPKQNLPDHSIRSTPH